MNCIHRCQEKCHPNKECPDIPCAAEIRIYCKCKTRFIQALCNKRDNATEEEKSEVIECKSECLKKQRDQRLAAAFSNDGFKNDLATDLQFEYYPEDALEFGKANKKFVLNVEKMLTDVVYDKKIRTFPNLHGEKRQFITMLVHEHFHLDMCTYG